MDEPQLKPCWVPPWFKLRVIPLVEGKALRMIVVYTHSLLNPKPAKPSKPWLQETLEPKKSSSFPFQHPSLAMM
jgi:hypothetical protein